MGKPKAPPPPDYSGVAAASERSAELSFQLGREQLAWAREQYDRDATIYNRIIDGMVVDQQNARGDAQRDRMFYEQTFQPLEKALAEEAKTYDTPERRAREMGAAQAGVAQQFDAQRENAQRELEAYGIDPTSTRYGALDIGIRTSQAAAQAAAGTVAQNRVEDVGRALRSEAINVGRGYPGQVASSYATSNQAGTGAGAMVGNATQIGAQTMGTTQGYMAGGNQAIGQWGNTLNMSYQNQLAQFNANQQARSGFGSALGLIGGIGLEAFGLAKGGAVPDPRAEGAIPEEVSPSGGAAVDDVPVRLNVGEFVIPEDVVSWHGEKAMYALIEKAARERDEAKQRTGAIPEEGPPLQTPPVMASA